MKLKRKINSIKEPKKIQQIKRMGIKIKIMNTKKNDLHVKFKRK
jgi:hypothetical protein